MDFLPSSSVVNLGSIHPRIDTQVLKKALKPSEAIPTIVVDHHFDQDHLYDLYYEPNGEYFHATMTYVNCMKNINKFVILQILNMKGAQRYMISVRRGRIGSSNYTRQLSLHSNIEEAKSVFEKVFFEKTGNQWSNRHAFLKKSSKYEFVEVFYTSKISPPFSAIESNMDSKKKNFLTFAYNCKNTNDALNKLNFDMDSIKMGIVSFSQVQKGYTALKVIWNMLETVYDIRKLTEAVDEYYMKIPHKFNRKLPPLLCSMQQIKEELEYLWKISRANVALDVFNLSDIGILLRKEIEKHYWRLESVKYVFSEDVLKLDLS